MNLKSNSIAVTTLLFIGMEKSIIFYNFNAFMKNAHYHVNHNFITINLRDIISYLLAMYHYQNIFNKTHLVIKFKCSKIFKHKYNSSENIFKTKATLS